MVRGWGWLLVSDRVAKKGTEEKSRRSKLDQKLGKTLNKGIFIIKYQQSTSIRYVVLSTQV